MSKDDCSNNRFSKSTSTLKKCFYLFIYGSVGSSLLLRLFSSCGAQGRLYLPGACFSLLWFLLLWSTGSRAPGCYQMWHMDSAAAAPGFENTGTWVRLMQSMWDLPVSRMESVSPALAGGFFTTEPPGKPDIHFQIIKRCTWSTIAQVQCCFCVGIEKTSRDPQPCWFSKCGPQSFSLDSRVPQSSGPYSELLRISESRAQKSVFFVCLSDFENH